MGWTRVRQRKMRWGGSECLQCVIMTWHNEGLSVTGSRIPASERKE